MRSVRDWKGSLLHALRELVAHCQLRLLTGRSLLSERDRCLLGALAASRVDLAALARSFGTFLACLATL